MAEPEAQRRLISPGLRYMVLAAFYFSLMSLFVKLAGQRLHSTQIVFARSVVALIICFVMIRRIGVSPWGNNKGLLVFRGAIGFAGLLCLFWAYTHLPLADATVIQYTNPVFTALLAAVFLHESLGRNEIIGLLCSLVGVVLVAQPSFLFGANASPLPVLGVCMALAGAVFSAMAYTAVRKLGETEHYLVVILYFPLIATPLSVPVMAPFVLWPTPLEWALLIGVGIVTQTAQIYLTKGLHAERAGRAMSMSYIQIIFAALWGMLFFSEYPDLLSIGGAVLVVGGTLLVARSSTKPSEATDRSSA